MINTNYMNIGVQSVYVPDAEWTFVFNESGFKTKWIANPVLDSSKIIWNYNHDSINNLFIVEKNRYFNNKLNRTEIKRYQCHNFYNILDIPRLDFVTDSRLNIKNFINDTIYLYEMNCIDSVEKYQSPFYEFSTSIINSGNIDFIITISQINKNEYEIIYSNPIDSMERYSEVIEFDSKNTVKHIVKKYSTHTDDYSVKSKNGKIRSTISNTIRRDENFIYSISSRKYKYNKYGLITKQKTETSYIIQGHTTKSIFKFKYQINK